jgi:hypothetical protein
VSFSAVQIEWRALLEKKQVDPSKNEISLPVNLFHPASFWWASHFLPMLLMMMMTCEKF